MFQERISLWKCCSVDQTYEDSSPAVLQETLYSPWFRPMLRGIQVVRLGDWKFEDWYAEDVVTNDAMSGSEFSYLCRGFGWDIVACEC